MRNEKEAREWIMQWAAEQHYPHMQTPFGEFASQYDWQVEVMLLNPSDQEELALWLKRLLRIPILTPPIWKEDWAELPLRERIYRAAACLGWQEIESSCHGQRAIIGGSERWWEVASRRWDFDALMVIWQELDPLVARVPVGSGVR